MTLRESFRLPICSRPDLEQYAIRQTRTLRFLKQQEARERRLTSTYKTRIITMLNWVINYLRGTVAYVSARPNNDDPRPEETEVANGGDMV